jgi:hypothetical protein
MTLYPKNETINEDCDAEQHIDNQMCLLFYTTKFSFITITQS